MCDKVNCNCGHDSCCGDCEPWNCVEQAVNDVWATKEGQIEGLVDRAETAAENSEASAKASADSAAEAKEYRDEAEQAATTAVNAEGIVISAANTLQDTADKLKQIADELGTAIAGITIVTWYYTTVQEGQTIIPVPADRNEVEIQAIYIEGSRQEPNRGFTYDKLNREIVLAEPLPLGLEISIIIGTYSENPVDFPNILAGNNGATLVGTSSGVTVQQEINNLRQENSDTDKKLRVDLAKPTGAAAIGATGGVTVQSELNRINGKIYVPEDFGCDVAAADNTSAVNTALQSGKPVIWSESKVYKVVDRIQASKDVYDLHYGVMTLNVARYNLGQVKVVFANKVQEQDPIRGMYVESAYDFSELAFIKSLGINTIIHYGNFTSEHVAIDKDGSLTKVADNVRALGMRLMVNTEVRDVKDPTLTLGQFVQKFNNHPAVFAWSTFDEAMSRGISYAAQETQYNEIRAYSNKPISLVDAWYNTDVISNKILDYYDIVLADPYPQGRTGMSLAQAIQEDLKYMRRCYAVMQAHSRQKNVIPVLGLSLATGAPGTQDPMQAVGAAENFRKAGNGAFVCFVWDGLGDPGAIASGIRGNDLFIACVKSSAERKYPVPYVTQSLLFGGNGTIGHQPLNNIIDHLPVRDPSTTDPYIGGNAFPIHIFGGASVNTDRGITTPGWNISGIGFKTTVATLVTDIPYRKNVFVYGDYSVVDTGVLDGSLQLLGTFDGGYTSNLRATQNTSGTYAAINLHTTSPDPNERVCIKTTSVTDSNVMRRIFSGILVSCEW